MGGRFPPNRGSGKSPSVHLRDDQEALVMDVTMKRLKAWHGRFVPKLWLPVVKQLGVAGEIASAPS